MEMDVLGASTRKMRQLVVSSYQPLLSAWGPQGIPKLFGLTTAFIIGLEG
jgi:hypothetical protein